MIALAVWLRSLYFSETISAASFIIFASFPVPSARSSTSAWRNRHWHHYIWGVVAVVRWCVKGAPNYHRPKKIGARGGCEIHLHERPRLSGSIFYFQRVRFKIWKKSGWNKRKCNLSKSSANDPGQIHFWRRWKKLNIRYQNHDGHSDPQQRGTNEA